jgi:transposase
MNMNQYSNEFKEQAIKLSDDIGLKNASEQLGINNGTLAGWRKIRKRNSSEKSVQYISPLTERERKLLKENQELKEANEILKDALGFFAKDRKKLVQEISLPISVIFRKKKRLLL